MLLPKRRAEPTKMIRELWDSLQRVGGQFRAEAICDPMENGYFVILGLVDALPIGAKKNISAYIKGFAEAAGWTVTKVKFLPRFIQFVCEERDQATDKTE